MAGRGISRINLDTVTGGSLIIGPPKSSTVFVDNRLVALDSALVEDGDNMIKTCKTVFIEFLNPDRELDLDTGDHVATGSPDVICGD